MILYYMILYNIILYYIILYDIILYYIILYIRYLWVYNHFLKFLCLDGAASFQALRRYTCSSPVTHKFASQHVDNGHKWGKQLGRGFNLHRATDIDTSIRGWSTSRQWLCRTKSSNKGAGASGFLVWNGWPCQVPTASQRHIKIWLSPIFWYRLKKHVQENARSQIK